MTTKKRVPVVTAHLLGRYILQENDTFSTEKAHSLVQTHRPKNDHTKTKTKLKIHSDRLQVAKGSMLSDIPPPLVYPFDNIVRYFVFKSDPRVLVLGVMEKGNKVFVIFRFKHLLVCNHVCDIIDHKKGPDMAGGYTEPQEAFVESEEQPKAHASVTFQGEPNRYEEIPPPSNGLVDESMVAVHVERPVESSVVLALDRLDQPDDNVDVKYIDCQILDDTEELEPVKVQEDYASPVILRTNDSEPRQKSLWHEDIKYLTYDPQTGSHVTENGPIYMYTAHQLTPEFRAYSTCEASSSSSESDEEGETSRMSLNAPMEAHYDVPGPSTNEYSYANIGGTSAGAGTYDSVDEHSYEIGGDTSTGADTSYGVDGGPSYGVSGGASFGVTNPGFRVDY